MHSYEAIKYTRNNWTQLILTCTLRQGIQVYSRNNTTPEFLFNISYISIPMHLYILMTARYPLRLSDRYLTPALPLHFLFFSFLFFFILFIFFFFKLIFYLLYFPLPWLIAIFPGTQLLHPRSIATYIPGP